MTAPSAKLKKLLAAAKQLGTKESDRQYPEWANNGAKRALSDFFHPDDELAIDIDLTVRQSKHDSWVRHPMKERVVRIALQQKLAADYDRRKLAELFELVKARHEYH